MHVTARLPSYASAGDERRLASAGLAIFLLIGAVQALYGPSIPAIRATFHLDAATAGWTVGAHYCGSVAGVLLSLPLETRLAARSRLVLGLLSMGVGAAAFAAIPTWPLALLGVVAIGLGYGLLTVVVNALFAAGFGTRSAALLTLVNAAFGFGAVLGPLLFGVLSSNNFRPAFGLAALFLLLCIPLAWGVRGETEVDVEVALPSSRHLQFALAGFVLLFLLYTGTESDTSGWMATHLTSNGFTRSAAANLTAAFWAALTLGRLLAVPLTGRVPPARLVTGSFAAAAIVVLAARIAPLAPWAYVLEGLLIAPIFPVGFAWMQSALPGVRGTASLALLGALGGGLIFPVLVGRWIGAAGANVLPLALAILATSALVVTLRLPGLIAGARGNGG